jgi:ferredoxin
VSRRNVRLVVDPIACDGYGACAELLPEWIEADEWGYPVIRMEAIPPHLRDHTMRAVHGCPKLALRLVPAASR